MSFKFLLVPSLLVQYSGADMWLSILTALVAEFLLLAVTVCILKRLKRVELDSALTVSVGSVLTKLILIALFLILFVGTFITIKQTYFYLIGSVYEEFNFLMFIIPIIIVGIYFCISGSRAFFRSAEIFIWFLVLGLAIALGGGVFNINNLSANFPVLQQGIKPILTAVYKTFEYFGAFLVFLLFAGKVDINKHFKTAWLGVGAVIVVLGTAVAFIFYNLFGAIGVFKELALVDFAQFINFSKDIRVDWIVILAFLVALVFQFGVAFYGCYWCAKKIFNIRKVAVVVLPLSIIVFIVNVFLFTNISQVASALDYIRGFIFFATVLIPLVIYISVVFGRRRIGLITEKQDEELKEQKKGAKANV